MAAAVLVVVAVMPATAVGYPPNVGSRAGGAIIRAAVVAISAKIHFRKATNFGIPALAVG
jgi:hypothetical protein